MNIIAHVDEIFLKGTNQPFFYRTLVKNIAELLPGAKAKRVEGAVWIDGVEEKDLDFLRNFPGIANFAPAYLANSELIEIKSAVDKVLQTTPAKTFRVSTTRSHKSHQMSSREMDIAVGDYVAQKYGLKVNLTKFDLEVHIDVGKDGTAVYGNLTHGAGGLPVKTIGRVLCLLSGGIDSPVAAYEIMRRGAEVVFVHFQNQTQVSEQVGEKIFDLVKVLARYQDKTQLIIVPFGDIQRQIIMKAPADYRMIISRRIFFRLAQSIAQKEKCLALVTGDSLGQVASQTLENMSAIYDVSPMLKLAPLVGANKRDIITVARTLGTFDISSRPYEDCCSLFVARHPRTKAKLTDVKKIEQGIDMAILDKIKPISYYIGSN